MTEEKNKKLNLLNKLKDISETKFIFTKIKKGIIRLTAKILLTENEAKELGYKERKVGAPKWFKEFEKKNDARWEEFHDFKENQEAFNKNQEAFNSDIKTFVKNQEVFNKEVKTFINEQKNFNNKLLSLPTIKKELNEQT